MGIQAIKKPDFSSIMAFLVFRLPIDIVNKNILFIVLLIFIINIGNLTAGRINPESQSRGVKWLKVENIRQWHCLLCWL
jgi:hypothetical protein